LRSTLIENEHRDGGTVQPESIIWKLVAPLVVVDVIMGMGATFVWLANVDIVDVAGTVLLAVSLFTLYVLIWITLTLREAAALRPWQLRGSSCSDQELLVADRAIEMLPARVALGHLVGHPVYFGGLFLATQFVFPELWSFGTPERAAMGLQLVAIISGPPVMMYPLASLLVQDAQTGIATELGRRKLEQSRTPAHLETRMIVAAMGMVVAIVFWLSGSAFESQGETARQVAAVSLREATLNDAKHLAGGAQSVREFNAVVTREQLPPLLAAQTDQAERSVSVIDKRYDRALAAAPVGDGRWVVGETDVAYDQRNLWIRLAVELFIIIFGIGLMILAMARLITAPLDRLRQALRRVTEAGVISEIGRIPVVRKDEIGELTAEFNHMLDVFDELAAAARGIAAGDLRVQIEGPGDLQDSFRSMVARLGELVLQIREAALEVAGATAEIHAATYEQEHAAGQQSDEIREVSIAIERLAHSAGDISTAAGEVLSNAEHTRNRADEVGKEIAELGRHITRIGELLELIRDVADRSDLLALNGSLEATRAGEAGRGFALVANEMRRLAERVTGTVADVRATIAAIGTSNSATVVATEDSRELAGSTTAAARRIVDVIHTQGTETELCSTAARTIADAVASSAAAITQTRASADGLRERAERLERLIEQFHVPDRR
jgi:methyl-accepting chemotaxis protein